MLLSLSHLALLPVLTSAAPKLVTLGANENVGILCAAAPLSVVTVTASRQGAGGGTAAVPAQLTSTATSTTSSIQAVAPKPSSSTSASSSRDQRPSTPSAPADSATSGSKVSFNGYRNSLYFTNWGIYGANYQPNQLPASQLTHVLYAFANIQEDGTVVSSDTWSDYQKHYDGDSWNDRGNNAYGCVKQLYLLKKKNRNMKVLLSIGGWTYSSKFAPVAASADARQHFASSAVVLVKDWGLDGIDIDWEYPANAEQAANFVLLLKACRDALDAYAAAHAPGYHFLVTIAAPAGPSNFQTLAVADMDKYVDFWHLMAYDYAGSWDSVAGHQANLYPNPSAQNSTPFNTDQAIAYFAKTVSSPSKISLGMPLYGRAFESTTGLGQAFSGVGSGDSGTAGVYLYKNLPRAGASDQYDDTAKASYSYDSASKEFVTYDNVFSALVKTDYMRANSLGGAVYWEASGDRNDTERSIVAQVAGKMAGMGAMDTSQNLLSFPVSQYDNIKAGMS